MLALGRGRLPVIKIRLQRCHDVVLLFYISQGAHVLPPRLLRRLSAHLCEFPGLCGNPCSRPRWHSRGQVLRRGVGLVGSTPITPIYHLFALSFRLAGLEPFAKRPVTGAALALPWGTFVFAVRFLPPVWFEALGRATGPLALG